MFDGFRIISGDLISRMYDFSSKQLSLSKVFDGCQIISGDLISRIFDIPTKATVFIRGSFL